MSGMKPILMGLMLAGSTMSAAGTYQSGQAQKEAYEYNANVATEKGKYEEEQSRLRLSRLMGTQRALYAKAGVDLSSGSPLLTLAETAYQGEQEAQNIRRGYKSEATINRFYGVQASKAGTMGAISTFTQGLGQAGMAGYNAGWFNKTKVRI